jgi:hypothetical protein
MYSIMNCWLYDFLLGVCLCVFFKAIKTKSSKKEKEKEFMAGFIEPFFKIYNKN